MLMGMAVDSIIPRFRAGLSISFTVGFSFTFHNMDSTNRVGIISVVIVWSHEMAIVWLLNKSSIIEGHGVSSLVHVIKRITWISLLLESRGITISIIPRFSISLTVGLRVSFSFTLEVSVWLNKMAIVGLNKTGSHGMVVVGGRVSRLMIVERIT